MKTEELKEILIANGWTMAKQPFKDTGVEWYAYKRLCGASDCICNDKAPSLCINPSEIELDGKTWQSAEFSVVGEKKVGWLDMKVYGIKFEDVMATAPKAEAALRAAWEAA